MLKHLFITLLFLFSIQLYSQEKDSTEFVQFFYNSGELNSEGYMIGDRPVGYWKSYYRNGNLKTEGNRIDELLDGQWKFYSEAGKLELVINYSAGKKEGERIAYYENGNPSKREIFREDKKEGITTQYFPDGKRSRQIPFVNNREQGQGFAYDQKEVVITLLQYKSGVLVKEQFINRYDDNGLRKGTWMAFHPNMQRSEEGMYNKDLKHGYWKYYKPNGNLIRIEKWINGVLVPADQIAGKIDIKRTRDPNTGKIVSEGPYQNGKKQGMHQIYDENGKVKSAEVYENDILLAEGEYDELGRKQGLWKYYYLSGELKEKGQYKDDLKTKKWEYYFTDGSIEQLGYYNRGKPTGIWKWFYQNREVRLEEEYENGLEEGLSTEYNDSGAVIATGEYVEGMKEGTWVYTVGNLTETGSYYEGEKEGKWISTYLDNNKKAFEGSYLNGVKEGKHIYYHPNGNPKRREIYNNGTRNGIWEFLDEQGNAYLSIEYKDGREVKYNGEKITYGKRVDRELAEEE